MSYSKSEIETIFNNCLNVNQLYKVCELFGFLIKEKSQQNSLHLHMAANLKYRKLIENESNKD